MPWIRISSWIFTLRATRATNSTSESRRDDGDHSQILRCWSLASHLTKIRETYPDWLRSEREAASRRSRSGGLSRSYPDGGGREGGREEGGGAKAYRRGAGRWHGGGGGGGGGEATASCCYEEAAAEKAARREGRGERERERRGGVQCWRRMMRVVAVIAVRRREGTGGGLQLDQTRSVTCLSWDGLASHPAVPPFRLATPVFAW